MINFKALVKSYRGTPFGLEDARKVIKEAEQNISAQIKKYPFKTKWVYDFKSGAVNPDEFARRALLIRSVGSATNLDITLFGHLIEFSFTAEPH